MSGLSQLERDLISQRTKEGLASAKEEIKAEEFKLFLEYGEQEIKLVERIVEFRLKELAK